MSDNMNVPDSIYRNYTIIEKDILGVIHYCAVKKYKIGPFTLKLKMKTHTPMWANVRFDSSYGRCWHPNLRTIKSAIKYDNEIRRDKYIRRLLK